MRGEALGKADRRHGLAPVAEPQKHKATSRLVVLASHLSCTERREQIGQVDLERLHTRLLVQPRRDKFRELWRK